MPVTVDLGAMLMAVTGGMGFGWGTQLSSVSEGWQEAGEVTGYATWGAADSLLHTSMLPAYIQAWTLNPDEMDAIAMYSEAMAQAGFGSATASYPTIDPLADLQALAAAQYTPNNFVIGGFRSSSSDPYVRWVDQMLYNGGQPLTAGSAQLYGTYFDPRAIAAVKLAMGIVGLVGSAMGMIFGGPLTILIGAAGSEGASDLFAEGWVGLSGPSSQEARSAGQALSQVGPFIEAGLSIVVGAGTSIAGQGIRPLRGGIPGVGRAGQARGAVCDGVVGRALQRSDGRATVGASQQVTKMDQPLGSFFRLGGKRTSGPASWTQFRQACFTSEMEVLTARGMVRWDQLTESDRVASCPENDPDGPIEYKQVEEIFRTTGRIWHVHVGGKVIRTTGEHPFYVRGLGWLPAHSLLPGYELRSHTKEWLVVEDVLDTGEEEVCYNCRVADFHTYFVGGRDWGFTVWAHNAYQLHHSDPVFMGGARDQVRTRMGRRDHQRLHRDLNRFLRTQTNELGNHMRPQRNNSRLQIQDNFSREQRLGALAEFYRNHEGRYPIAARDFFNQHPSLR